MKAEYKIFTFQLSFISLIILVPLGIWAYCSHILGGWLVSTSGCCVTVIGALISIYWEWELVMKRGNISKNLLLFVVGLLLLVLGFALCLWGISIS